MVQVDCSFPSHEVCYSIELSGLYKFAKYLHALSVSRKSSIWMKKKKLTQISPIFYSLDLVVVEAALKRINVIVIVVISQLFHASKS